MKKRIGLVAGAGKFPIVLANAANKRGIKVMTIAIKEETDPKLEAFSDKIVWFSVGELDKIVNTFIKEKIESVFMAGKIKKTIMYSDIDLDNRLKTLLNKLENRNDDVILNAFVSELSEHGIIVRNSAEYIPELLAPEGVLTKIRPDEQTVQDIRYGFSMAKQIAGLDIGQTVVVKDKAVLAVEAIEGTDKAIERGGILGNGGIVVAKVAKPSQDMRFDIPVVGITTLAQLEHAKARAIVIESGKTILLDKDELISRANDKGIAIVGIKSAEDIF